MAAEDLRSAGMGYRCRLSAKADIGLWRSLAARLTGGQEVAGSNPASPTTGIPCTARDSVYWRGSSETSETPRVRGNSSLSLRERCRVKRRR